jgi:predicted RNA-binding Zn ribbon-like protein
MSTLAFALAATIRHDGHGGVADLLATPSDATAWLDEHQDLIAAVLGRNLEMSNPGELRGELVRIRGAVRTLFARAVAPEPPSKADSDRLLDAGTAVRMVNRAADRLGTAHLNWPGDEQPAARWSGRTENETALLVGAVGRSTIDFLAGPDRARLRACPAARCVKYFLQDDPRQTWCSPSCGNRERVNRHYRRQHGR